ncbi:DUF5106 domain-containing protein [uncultured Bacteroides sp.]|uniref:DUF5106 domain-containing protein n=1 Tax=uncultured Bacteroides sp. TaxID=162156 RepID=UPI002597A758|nr:DUF5106 domain-containing protein [uncultured Bacteroides sp.]
MKKQLSYVLLIGLIACACVRPKSAETAKEPVTGQDSTQRFELPVIPATLTVVAQREDYLIRHYWDHFPIAAQTTVFPCEKKGIEQAWVNFCYLLLPCPEDYSEARIKETFHKFLVNKVVLKHFMGLADKYWYDPNSPIRNEEFYIAMLETILRAPVLTDTEKLVPEARYELAQKNRKGSRAIDFVYTLKSGKQGTLHALRSDYTLLFINNPGCHACEAVISELKSSALVSRMLADHELTLLAMYTDENLSEWNEHLSDFPKEWINGYDSGQLINAGQLYDLRAIPTLYLLDAEKNVLLKDAPFAQIEEYLILHPVL